MLVSLAPVQDNLLLLFLGSVLLTTALEWLTGFILEKLFHDKWWDYSNMPFNIGGYVCLKFSLLWGLACVFIVRIVQPPITWTVGLLPHTLGVIFLCVLFAAFAVDFTVTLVNVLKLPKQLRAIEELEEKLRVVSDGIGGNLSEKAINVKEKTDAYLVEHHDNAEAMRRKLHRLRTQSSYIQRRLLRAFPRLSEGRWHDVLSRMREAVEQAKEKRGK